MPRYDFSCPKCGTTEERTASVGTNVVPCRTDCGGKMLRQFPTIMQFIMPDHMKKENENCRARQRLYMDRPDVKEKMQKGILAPE